MKWKPIKGDPKKGARILVTDGVGVEIAFYAEDYNTRKKAWCISHSGDDFTSGSYYAHIKPTHWMPLPDIPEVKP